jgi:hypothetical protein
MTLSTSRKLTLNDTRFALVLVLIFSCLGIVGILNHEMWADELHAWLIGRDSSNLWELWYNCRNDGHPILWHACTYLLNAITDDARAMQFFHLALAGISLYVFARYSPFSRLHKVLFSFGYFPFYEYAIISRQYVFGVLFLFSFCALYGTRRKSYLLLSTAVAMLANTSLFGAILAISLALALIVDAAFDTRTRESLPQRRLDVLLSALIVLAGLVFSVAKMIPPPGEGFPAPWRTDFSILKLAKVITAIWNSYVPLPNFFTAQFWNTNIFDYFYPHLLNVVGPVHVLLALMLLALATAYLVRTPVALFCYLCGTFGTLLFMYAKYFGYLRHHGHLFILLIASLWLSHWYGKTDLPCRMLDRISLWVHGRSRFLLTILLSANLAAGLYAYSMDLARPFSASSAVADLVRSRALEKNVIAAYPDWLALPFAYHFRRKIFYPNIGRLGSFVVYDASRRHQLECPALLQVLRDFMEKIRREILLISASPVNCSRTDLQVTLVTSVKSEPILVYDKIYYVYRVSLK